MCKSIILSGERVLYRYSPAGLPVYGVVVDSYNGGLAVRTNLTSPNGQYIVMYRRAESWQLLSDTSKLHSAFKLEVSLLRDSMVQVVKQHYLQPVDAVMAGKLLRI